MRAILTYKNMFGITGPTLRKFWLFTLSTALVACVGCGEKQLKVFPVSGKIVFEGKPPVGAMVALHPQGDILLGNLALTGVVKEDGTFKISAYGTGDGAPAGDYVATVAWYKVVVQEGGSGKGPNVIPKEYSDVETSPIKVTVKTEPTELQPIQIASK